jgi:hypothetical protein
MFYRPVQFDNRYFGKSIHYKQIDFAHLSSIIPAFEQRITDWYISPADLLAADWHNAFSVAAFDCLLIDTLAQFDAGASQSAKTMFIEYVKKTFPQFRTPLPAPIKRPGKADITLPAEVLYFAFRCGILHEAHIPPYAQMIPEPGIVRAQATGIATYPDGTDCCAVILDPLRLYSEIKTVFKKYLSSLLDPAPLNDLLRINFKKKFTANYGIDIMSAA